MDFLLLFMQQTFNDNSQKLLEILLFSSSNFPKKKKTLFFDPYSPFSFTSSFCCIMKIYISNNFN